jgi:fermentation-respiration switch protein FrsA (DUF1100 family)
MEQADRLFAAAGEPREIWRVDGGEHGAIMLSHPEEYERHVVGFLSKWLAPPMRRAKDVSSSR